VLELGSVLVLEGHTFLNSEFSFSFLRVRSRVALIFESKAERFFGSERISKALKTSANCSAKLGLELELRSG